MQRLIDPVARRLRCTGRPELLLVEKERLLQIRAEVVRQPLLVELPVLPGVSLGDGVPLLLGERLRIPRNGEQGLPGTRGTK